MTITVGIAESHPRAMWENVGVQAALSEDFQDRGRNWDDALNDTLLELSRMFRRQGKDIEELGSLPLKTYSLASPPLPTPLLKRIIPMFLTSSNGG